MLTAKQIIFTYWVTGLYFCGIHSICKHAELVKYHAESVETK